MDNLLLKVLTEELNSEIKLILGKKTKYCFTTVRNNVMHRHSKKIGTEWIVYAKALSSRRVRKNLLVSPPKSNTEQRGLRELQIREATAKELAEAKELGGLHYDPKSGCIFGLDMFWFDEAI